MKVPKCVWWNDQVKVAVRRKKLLGRRFWEIVMKKQKKNVCKCTVKKKGRK